MDCDCGARRCRKRITESDWKLAELQRKYDGYFSEYIQEKIDKKRGRRRFVARSSGGV
jgi:hypothetical protein